MAEQENNTWTAVFVVAMMGCCIFGDSCPDTGPTKEERMDALEDRWDGMSNEEKGDAIADELRRTNPELFD